MKVLPFKIPKPANAALIFQVDEVDSFYDKFHQHDEIQVSIILNGEGDLILGDSVTRFSKNDVFVIGSNIPHLFRSDEITGLKSRMFTLFFTKTSFGSNFFNLPEMEDLHSFFQKADAGILVLSDKNQLKELFLKLEHRNALERFILFLQILQLITQAETKPLSSFIYHKKYTEDEGKRMSDVMHFTISHYQKEITLAEIANIANMTPNAFCRYFKQRTNKTFFQFLLELRLEHAGRLLRKETDFSVSLIAEMTGFRNLSNFNRKFKSYTGQSPTKYKKSFFSKGAEHWKKDN